MVSKFRVFRHLTVARVEADVALSHLWLPRVLKSYMHMFASCNRSISYEGTPNLQGSQVI